LSREEVDAMKVPTVVVVTLPPGRELDTMAVHEILETLARVAARTGIA
jgi:hypothetical protein